VELYKPSEQPQRLVLSNMQYGLMRWFYNRGHYKTVSEKEARFLDQRSFGPAVAKGLLAFDGAIWYITEAGIAFMEQFERRDPWKEQASRQYSHYIRENTKLIRTLRVIEGGKPMSRAMGLRKKAMSA
jgi:hypothetical protein